LKGEIYMQEFVPWISALLGFLGGAAFAGVEALWKGKKRRFQGKAQGSFSAPFHSAFPGQPWAGAGARQKEENTLFHMLDAVERYDGGKEV
jgi:hypothetical protein